MVFESITPEKWTYQYLMTDVWDKYGDVRTNPYFPGGPGWLISTILVYLFFVLYLGPRLMKNRPAFVLRKPMIIYNAINVLLSALFFTKAMISTRGGLDTYGCDAPTDNNFTDFERSMWGWFYLGMKIFDLLDTVFFVLRKKQNQITPLHVSHHCIMPFTVYFAIKFIPVITSLHTLIINSFTHTLMYALYGMAAAGGPWLKYMWLKKYMTTVQLIQFFIAGIHASHLLFNPYCNYPRLISGLELTEAVYFTYFFWQFYKRSYKEKPVSDKLKNGTNGTVIHENNNNFNNNHTAKKLE